VLRERSVVEQWYSAVVEVLEAGLPVSWRVERALSWLSCWRRLAVRWDRDSERWFALVLLACALTCLRRL
jgi:hypothetical protein